MFARIAGIAGVCASSAVLASILAGCGGSGSSLPSAAATQPLGFTQPAGQFRGSSSFVEDLASGRIRPVCSNLGNGKPHCLSYLLVDKSRAPHAQGHPDVSGYGPPDLQSAYNLGSVINNPGGTVALVLWYNDPNMDSDLAVYRSNFGLPACRESTGCLKQVNETGGSTLPQNDSGSALEESLDVDMVSANCPNCKIIYVEATGPNTSDLEIAENTAAGLAGVVAISNSWSYGNEQMDSTLEASFNHPNVAIVASADDYGYGAVSPTDYNTLTSAVGTTLRRGGGSRGWTETVWNGTGSGCSSFVPARKWQKNIKRRDHLRGCTKRVIGDIAYVADPNTGVAVYDTFGESGWIVVGGTSASSPAEAALYALNGNHSGIPARLAYTHLASFYDITSGSNGSCSPTWLCTAQAKFDAPSGVGSPNGIAGF